MIKVKVERKENFIKQIKITGHAKYDEYGKDIVCAGVSSALITTVNACLLFDQNSIEYNEENDFKLVNISENNITNKLLENLYNVLTDLEKNYKKNIQIKED